MSGKFVLEDLEQIDKSPLKCRQTRDPKTRGKSPKRVRTAMAFYRNRHLDPKGAVEDPPPRAGKEPARTPARSRGRSYLS